MANKSLAELFNISTFQFDATLALQQQILLLGSHIPEHDREEMENHITATLDALDRVAVELRKLAVQFGDE